MLLSTLLPTPTISTASTSVTLATPANRVGVAGQGRGSHQETPATVPSRGSDRDPLLLPGEREFTGPQEDPAMLATMTTAAGLKRAAGKSPSGFPGYCWLLTQPSAAQ